MDRRTFLAQTAALATLVAAGDARAAEALASNFHVIYDDPALRDRFFLFFQNVFSVFPPARFHQLVIDLTAQHTDDQAIYEALQAALPGIEPLGAEVTLQMPALAKQKRVLANQAAMHLQGIERIDGSVEIGSLGRYIGPISERLPLEGAAWIVNDVEPGNGPIHVLERGQLAKNGTYVPLGDYDPLGDGVIDDESVDLVTNFIGFHHCPGEQLDGFVDGIRRVLRPGGHLLLREHDVDGETMDTMVALAHDVFNAGVFLSWDDNAAQIRRFRSKEDWTEYLQANGFSRTDLILAQAHDPTDNVLLHFVKA